MRPMRQHCVQCLTEILANGRQAPTGETLCGSCYSALWGPTATEELRSLVRLHTGRRLVNGRVLPQRG
jgi:hypothetical protein